MDDRALSTISMQVAALQAAVFSLLATATNKSAVLDNFNVHAEALLADLLSRSAHDYIVDDLETFLDQFRQRLSSGDQTDTSHPIDGEGPKTLRKIREGVRARGVGRWGAAPEGYGKQQKCVPTGTRPTMLGSICLRSRPNVH